MIFKELSIHLNDIILDKSNKFIPQRMSEKYIKKNYISIYNIILGLYDNSYSFKEKIYCISKSLTTRPKCKSCNNELLFNNGYASFCSRKCSNSDPEIKLKISSSAKETYSNKSNDEKELILEKRKNTLKNTYGIDSYSPFASKNVQDKSKQTILSKYGVNNPYNIDHVKNKRKKSFQKKSILKYKTFGYDIEYLEKNKTVLVKNLCDIHNDCEFSIIDFYNRARRNRNGIICNKCNPINSFSSGELEIKNFLDQYGIEYEINKILPSKKHIDIFIPKFNVGIEFNGLYWHSELFKDKNYHMNKTKECDNLGINLIHVWEDDWYNKQDIIKSIIKNKLNLSSSIYARKCIIKEIDGKSYKNFLDLNHLQGHVPTKIKLGLYFNDELVSVMGISKTRKCLGFNDNNYELYRFCNKLNTRVVGGASKLFKYFDRHFTYDKIISYANRDWSNGNLYNQLKFKKKKYTSPGYFWVLNNKKYHRYNFRKDILVKQGYDSNLTESQIMKSRNGFKLYDTGNILYEKIK